MEKIIQISQVMISIALIVIILVQQKGTGLGGVFGGQGNVYRTKRGFEKFLHYLTIVLAIIFVTLSLVRFFV
ncbi:preprotein translocase subunit SecG [Candidatus Berkelbacteria bacterium CG_4_8_14_3_um_filter_33_6]|uniref:Protein-export membrane protein SecG n=1 Tax=Candidatus Berkelbacteria bacterium CG_4_10_14_0_2_um_filter_35_9_33_12 TaxID=1974499 RepID=A0A2M7W492_9BACT|nr:MAG: preprotein translocase subunit SecG [Candidatus Berkelbacteria bacterium CG23_combo_of_CG06-09_8_20_14_all_33_15]PIS08659.1 MAG: preprotein translocase subunit SecG [Candidatus Berkelbacteria bacterium CG10_big_fil_rev_8_21_14_0_10_33_10]PIX30930.1 MAG: preprotein translocase subunit SecG [Candidatus Berkelbacteria bacterium CG_4_8_14_3_um_filter_33_6]PIZ28022.1 MAG: preprotein translocase subunit SecG [Candidatus Berkelbacteria bacterium CG_4_10_14_0_8_um_filter_35_9_33_8]PJA20047.1 MA